jgi:DNA uptake protein ComE-like DNA-binding protein
MLGVLNERGSSMDAQRIFGSLLLSHNWDRVVGLFRKHTQSSRVKKDSTPEMVTWLAPSSPFWGRAGKIQECISTILGFSTESKSNQKVFDFSLKLPLQGKEDWSAKKFQLEYKEFRSVLYGYVEGYYQGIVEMIIYPGRFAVVLFHVVPPISSVPIPLGYVTEDKTLVAKLDHYASKNAMNIDGFSESAAQQLVLKKGVRNFSDLYKLTAEDLAELEGFKDKKISNLLKAIEGSKTPTLDAFIYAIGVEGVGRVAAKDLAARFKSMQNLKNATCEELIALENVGEITANAIVEYFQDEENLAELSALEAVGVKPTWSDEKKEGVFSGESVVLPGTLSSFKRSEAQKLIEERGGVCQSSVTAKTTLVLAGEEAGSKLEKAKKLGIKIIDEETFKQML